MKRTTVAVRWTHGLHLRPAARLVRLAQQFRASLCLCRGERRADLRSILSIVSLCAMMGATLDLEAAGVDEESAVRAIERFFDTRDEDGPSGNVDVETDSSQDRSWSGHEDV